jgi:hypothetical protein
VTRPSTLPLIAWLAAWASAPALAADPPRAPLIPVSISVTPGFAALDERAHCPDRPETLYLSVHNEGAAPLTVDSVAVMAPTDLGLCGPVRATLAGGERRILPLPVGLQRSPRQGTAPLILQVEVAATIDGAERRDQLIASDDIEVRVPGVSDALRVLGVPTLLLLPGLLAVTAFFLLFRPKWREDFGPGKPAFWMVAISASAFLYWPYALATGRGGDFGERIGIADVAGLWVGSILVGAATGWGCQRIKNLRDSRETARVAKEAEKRRPTNVDSPLAMFDRLVLIGTFEKPPQWSTVGSRSGFVVELGDSEARWLIPKAVLDPTLPAGVDKTVWDRAVRDLRALVDAETELSKLANFLHEAKSAAKLVLEWKNGERPLKLDEDDRAQPGPAGHYFVERP